MTVSMEEYADEVGTVQSVGRYDSAAWKVLHRSLDAFGNQGPFAGISN